jgi:hypothetical protein
LKQRTLNTRSVQKRFGFTSKPSITVDSGDNLKNLKEVQQEFLRLGQSLQELVEIEHRSPQAADETLTEHNEIREKMGTLRAQAVLEAISKERYCGVCLERTRNG